jgi:hypothetical protein
MARELVACMWAIAKQVPVKPKVPKRRAIQPTTAKVSNVHRKRRSPGVV